MTFLSGEAVLSQTLGEQLSESQRRELETIMDEFANVLHGKPGQTHAAEHSIHTEARPIRQIPLCTGCNHLCWW